MNILILVIFLTLFISGICSLFEAILYSTRMAVLEAARTEGNHRRVATRFLEMKKDITQPTSAILILNTIANTGGATLAGMYAVRVLGLQAMPLFSIGLTLAILFFSEILPKTFGVTRWRAVWPHIVWPLTGIQKILAPAVWATQKISSLFTRGNRSPSVTEKEILALIRLGAQSGELTQSELKMASAVFHFDELVCRQVMVPRQEIVFLDPGAPLAASLELAKKTKHTRYPLCEGTIDKAIGLVHIKDLVGVSQDSPIDLASIKRPLRYVPETMPINMLLREIQRTHQHMAMVIDEYGTTVGMITLEIVLEQIVGAVQDEFDSESPDIVRESPVEFIVKGHLPIGRINRELNLDLRAPKVDTLSGLLMSRIGRLLQPGDRIELEGATAEVLEARAGRGTCIRLRLAQPVDTES